VIGYTMSVETGDDTMILRRADRLGTDDNVRLEDDRLWNIASITGDTSTVTLNLHRTAGDRMTLVLWRDDMVRLAV
jgi:hypothetical protein